MNNPMMTEKQMAQCWASLIDATEFNLKAPEGSKELELAKNMKPNLEAIEIFVRKMGRAW